MSERQDPAAEHSPGDPAEQDVDRAGADRDPLVGPDDVDPVDHAVDAVRIDGEESAIPGEWL